MELVAVQMNKEMVIPEEKVMTEVTEISSGNFIEANTETVVLNHLKNDTIIPVFAKDNETTISHSAFIEATQMAVENIYQDQSQLAPNIRVSHVIKGRIPTAIGKAVKDLLPHEKTIYYERMAFMIEIPALKENVNHNALSLVIGGVRAYNQENLYSKKSMERFKSFIGFKNSVCTNLCVSTDGFINDIRASNVLELQNKIEEMILSFNKKKQLGNMERLSKFHLTQEQFAHLMGKLKMYQFLSNEEKEEVYPIGFNDSQISHIVKDYYRDDHFKVGEEHEISFWNLYNLFTGATKSSYIDSFLQREVHAYEFTQELVNSIQNKEQNWFLHNNIIANNE